MPDGATDLQIWDWDLATFVDRTASADPTPGGGSASMVSAAIGLGLVLMALRVTAGNASDRDREALDPLLRSGEILREELSAHAVADLDVFEAYLAALGLPKRTEEERSVRQERLDQALRAATEVPLNAAQSSLEGLDLARQAVHLCDDTIVSDVGAGAALLNGALTATLYNVDVNLKGLKDALQRAHYQTSRDHLQRVADERHQTIRRVLASRLSPDAK
ncbi:MAG: cyclodeaminase/cyclohydrolase family protein [Pseudomonadota bacterium]